MLSSDFRATYDSLSAAGPHDGLMAVFVVFLIVVSVHGAEFNAEPFVRGRGGDALIEVDARDAASIVGESQRLGTVVAEIGNAR